MKKLSNLLYALENFKAFGSTERGISNITDDSRKAKEGYLFVAIPGETYDAHKFIPDAINKGVSAVIGEKKPQKSWLKRTTYIKVPNSREALSLLASAWYRNPSRKLRIIGVTGTDGKTTTSHLIYWLLKKAGKKVGLISTISAKIGDENYDTGFHVTNPEPLLLQQFLSQMVANRCMYAVLEVTSHGLDQERVTGISFDVSVLTNITHEHIDYHKTWKDYRKVKAKLFERTESLAVLNKDDESYSYISRLIPKRTKTVSYSLKSGADYIAKNTRVVREKMMFTVLNRKKSLKIRTNLLGDYNVSNILAAVAATRELGISWRVIKKALSTFPILVGRLEEVSNKKGFKTYVDFAHTPNSLKGILGFLNRQKKRKLIAIFGCAGERDIVKRQRMGEISGKLADVSVFTAEDPRGEDVNDIISEMAIGAKKSGAQEAKIGQVTAIVKDNQRIFVRLPERGDAISYAIQELARKGDIVVVCGKGHEKSMAYDGIEYPWSDREAVKIALRGGVKQINYHGS